MVDSIEQASSQVIHEMERYLNTLGTLAAVTPLLGLLGTVVGMIRVFSEITLRYGKCERTGRRTLEALIRAGLSGHTSFCFFPIFYA